MNCRNAESLFSAFLDDELSQGERRHFESHLLGCRRCSQSVRELKGAMALVNDAVTASAVEMSPHFEDDLMDRIRSGEAMRPTVIEWIQSFLVPDRLRPVFIVGASACAVFVAVVLFQGGGPKPNDANSPAMVSQTTKAPATEAPVVASTTAPEASKSEKTPPATTLASAAPAPSTAKSAAPRSNGGNGIVEIGSRGPRERRRNRFFHSESRLAIRRRVRERQLLPAARRGRSRSAAAVARTRLGQGLRWRVHRVLAASSQSAARSPRPAALRRF